MFEANDHSDVAYWLTRRQRFAVGILVLLYELALILFAALPLSTVVTPELVVVIGGVVVILGIVTHVSDIVSVPGDEWCYILAIVLNAYTLGAYVWLDDDDSFNQTISFSAFLAVGVVLPFVAHLLDGGAKNGRA